MPRPQRPWFRFYVEALSDRKLRRLTPAQRWLWVAVLGMARQSPVPGWLLVSEDEPMNAVDIADVAGMSVKEVERTLPMFQELRMAYQDHETKAWAVLNWADRQYESDSPTERSRRHRAKERECNVATTFPATPPETEADTDPLSPPGGEVLPFAVKPPEELREPLRRTASTVTPIHQGEIA